MVKYLSLLALSLWTVCSMAEEPINQHTKPSETLSDTLAVPKVENLDLSFADFDSITNHASILYASKVLNDNGFKLVFGSEVKQKKRYFSDITFAKGADFDESTHSWVTKVDVPYTYISMIYSDEYQQLCHYHIKFRNWVGYALFFGEALKAGYLLDEPYTETERKKRKKSVYFRYSDQSFIMFTEHINKDHHRDYYVDCWTAWSNYKDAKKSYEK